jgi:hypothetical protein
MEWKRNKKKIIENDQIKSKRLLIISVDIKKQKYV